LITTRGKTEKNTKKGKKLIMWTYRQTARRKGKMTELQAKGLNRLILTAAILSAVIFGALLTPPIWAALTYLLS
jgi:hypothetical protein